MKKLICIIITIATLFLVSCGETVAPTNTDPTKITTVSTTSATSIMATTETAAATTATTATTAGEPITVEQFVPTGYQKYSILSARKDIETPNCVILTTIKDHNTRNTWYYDKKSGAIRVLCSDPDCDHVFFNDTSTWAFDLDCPAAMMGIINNHL